MKKLLLTLAIIGLLIVGAAATLVIIDPAGASQFISIPRVQGKADTGESSNGESSGEQASEQSGEEEAVDDRRTAARRPPSRSEEDEEPEEPQIEIDKSGRFVRTMDQLPSGPAPRPEVYPFEIIRRTFPDASSITLDIAIHNASGIHWKTAYVALKSPNIARAQLFEIDDWAIDELVSLEYTFPRSELNDRLRGLRVISVQGEQRESALADLLARSRGQYLQALVPGDERQAATTAVDASLRAPGLLGMIGSLQFPFTGVQVEVVEPIPPGEKTLTIEIPESYFLPENPEMPVSGSNATLRDIQGLVRDFQEEGMEVQDSLRELVALLEGQPYEEAMEAGGEETLEEVRQHLSDFNRAGVRLSREIFENEEVDVNDVQPMIRDYSNRVLGQLSQVEQRIARVDSEFQFR